MAWVADTCLLIDVAEADPQFGVASAQLFDRLRSDGLVICPVSYFELAPLFNADEDAQRHFLHNLAATWWEPWTLADTREAYAGWNRYVATALWTNAETPAGRHPDRRICHAFSRHPHPQRIGFPASFSSLENSDSVTRATL